MLLGKLRQDLVLGVRFLGSLGLIFVGILLGWFFGFLMILRTSCTCCSCLEF
jgi:hypothetical protein